MSDNNEQSEEPVSRLNSIQRISAAYQSMYAPAEETEINETEIENEEDKNVTPT
tara:strand:- start:123 stop:284 length:162 start_codon:yes stop_codon:yes gene_type:complete